MTQVCMVEVSRYFRGSWHSGTELLAALAERDVDCRILTVAAPAADHAAERFGQDAVTTVVDRSHGLRRDLSLAAVIRRDVRAGARVFHANTVSAARATLLADPLGGVPLVVHLRNSAASSTERLLVKALMRRPRTSLVAVSDVARTALGVPVDGAAIIPNPVDPPVPNHAPLRSAVATVGVVTSQHPLKGFDRFVEIAIAARDLPVRFEVFGVAERAMAHPGSFAGRCYRKLVDCGLARSVSFNRPSKSMHASYARLDVCLVVSRRESFGRVAAEAMRAGVPLVIPAIPGLLETTDSGSVAGVYDPDDPSDAADRLAWLPSHRREALDRADAATRFSERYAPPEIARRVEAIYDALLDRSAEPSIMRSPTCGA